MIFDYDQIDPELLPPLDDFPPMVVNRGNIVEVREMAAALERPPKPDGLLESKTTILTDDGELDIYIYRGSDRPNQAAILWIHGGGYVLGEPEEDRALRIAVELDCTIFSVDYRLAPEHPFPAGPEDCYAALTWLMSGKSDYDVDLSKVAIGGASGGGGMTAGVALMNRDRDNFPLRLQLLIYPMLDNMHATPSGAFENHPVWNRAASDNAWEMYLDGTPGEDASPYASASRAKDLQGLPPTYISVGTADLFRDEIIDYARRLIEAGVPTELSVSPGIYHAGESFVPDAPVSERFRKSFTAALRDALA